MTYNEKPLLALAIAMRNAGRQSITPDELVAMAKIISARAKQSMVVGKE